MSSLSCGIVGLPNVGKSTIFSALTNAAAESGNFPFTTIEPNVAVVNVEDNRLKQLHNILNSKNIVFTNLKFVDIAGLVKGASKGEGLGNKFLANIREVDAIAHVLRCFEDDVTHVFDSVDPIRDMEVINLELALSDLQILEKRLTKLEKGKKSGDKDAIREHEIVQKVIDILNSGKKINIEKEFSIDDLKIVKQLNLIIMKPTTYILNYGNKQISSEKITSLKSKITENQDSYVEINGLLESEVKDFDEEEKKDFLQEYNIIDTGLKLLINEVYSLLNLITFYTAGPQECRAWSIKKSSKAPEAAGKIHTDFQKGFIRAEIIEFKNFIEFKSEEEVKKNGLMRSEGKDYIVKDGDIIHFRYNV